MRIKNLILIIFLLWTMGYGLRTAEGAVPHLINYQGRLTDSQGLPLDNVTRNITFRIYDAETGPGTIAPWEETHTSVPIQKGIFSVILGSITPLNLPFDRQYWLEIKVQDEVLTPRQLITSVGYAIKAEKTERAERLIDASAIESGTIPTTRLGSGSADNTKYLRGDQSWVEIFKTYDSGPRSFGVNENHTVTHNLGTTKIICQIFYRENSGANWKLCQEDYGDARTGYTTFYDIQDNSVSFATSGNGPYYKDGSGGIIYIRSGQYRVIIIALP